MRQTMMSSRAVQPCKQVREVACSKASSPNAALKFFFFVSLIIPSPPLVVSTFPIAQLDSRARPRRLPPPKP